MSIPKTRYLAVLFDADGVVQLPSAGWLRRMSELGGDGFVLEAFALELQALTGEADLPELLREALARRGRDASVVEQVLAAWHEVSVDQQVLDLIQRLRAAGYVVALATNQQSSRGRFMQQNLGFGEFFDAEFYSFEVGLAKPDPAYFSHIADALGFEPERIFMIDDVPANIAGAHAAGLGGEVHAIVPDLDFHQMCKDPTVEATAAADQGHARIVDGTSDNAVRLESMLGRHGIRPA